MMVWKIDQEATRHPVGTAGQALVSLAEYPRPNIEALRYADRLREGRTIGSGQVEGACKTIVGRRLKLNIVCWQVSMANRMASLCGVLYSDLWDRFWGHAAA